MESLKTMWQGWKRVAHAIGRVQTRILLTVFHLLILGPVALTFRLLGKSTLPYRSKSDATFWIVKPDHARGIEQYYQSY